ncbi:hypothetical protein CSHISOI_10060 [Colletotrichum shisoi]|uniref:Uncharacterized protein n=1 Tax=Colletotrichum shisoi TaxID=2078593 RepID=A0A5Q4BFA6_9PEZI|nr:hypothetical protein CSHISOI_10060 [Colletotrichum shisoi]
MVSFLDLPPELRSVIYHAYVAVEGGYICDTNGFIEGKLKQADGKPVCMALLFTCRLVAREMHGLALRVNTITFSTLSGNPGLRDLACKFDFLLHCVNSLRQKLLAKIGKYITQEAYDELRDLYPQFTPLLDALRARGSLPPLARGPYGEAPSVFQARVHLPLVNKNLNKPDPTNFKKRAGIRDKPGKTYKKRGKTFTKPVEPNRKPYNDLTTLLTDHAHVVTEWAIRHFGLEQFEWTNQHLLIAGFPASMTILAHQPWHHHPLHDHYHYREGAQDVLDEHDLLPQTVDLFA